MLLVSHKPLAGAALAFKFRRDMPVQEGYVIQSRPDEVLIDLGQEALKPGMKLILYREGKPIVHPVTARVLGADTVQLGVAKVSDTFDEYSKAVVLRHSGEIRPTDRFITR